MSGAEAVEQVRVRVLPDGRLTREDAARYLGHQSKTLAQWAMWGYGPKPIRVGGRIFYYRDDLDRFIKEPQPALPAASRKRRAAA